MSEQQAITNAASISGMYMAALIASIPLAMMGAIPQVQPPAFIEMSKLPFFIGFMAFGTVAFGGIALLPFRSRKGGDSS